MVALLSSVLNKTHSKLRLWIVTDCINFTTDEIRQFADSGKMKWPRDSRVAYVAADNLSFGLVKMFEVFSDEDNFEKKFFRLKEDAMDWLKSWNEKK